MVRSVKKSGGTLQICELCMFAYNDRKTAQECESFCRVHSGCSMEITKHAVGIFDSGKLTLFKKKE